VKLKHFHNEITALDDVPWTLPLGLKGKEYWVVDLDKLTHSVVALCEELGTFDRMRRCHSSDGDKLVVFPPWEEMPR
jgi:hypothetical protein